MIKEMKSRGKKGFTLLELIIVLSIMSIGTLMVAPNLKVFSDKKVRVEMDYAVDGIIEFIDSGKAYGRLNEKTAIIKFRDKDVVLMDERSRVIDKFSFPPSIYVISAGSINITGLGKIKQAQSINVYSRSGTVEREIITIKVGTSYVSRKKK